METIDSTELRELASLESGPCVSVYLNTWVKEADARKRARMFLQQRVRRALRTADHPHVKRDLERVRAEAERILESGGRPATAFFACESAGLFKVVPLDVPVEDQLVIDGRPSLRQLARLSDEYERTLLVLVDSEDARIYEVILGRVNDQEALFGDTINRKRADAKSPGWSGLHYQRHVREHIDRHLREVAARTTYHVDENRPHTLLVGGTQPTVDRFIHELPARVRTRVTDVVALPPDSQMADVVQAAMQAMQREERKSEVDGVTEAIDLAMADGPAALGIDEVLAAARQARLMTVYLATGFRESGTKCRECGALGRREEPRCQFCEGAVDEIDLGEALVRETITQDGMIDFVPSSQALLRQEGVVAKLRW